jgi:AraC-like DNA-binding protein
MQRWNAVNYQTIKLNILDKFLMISSSSSPISLRDIVYNEAGKNYSVPPHIHQHYQWYCVLHGGVDTLIENKTFSLNPDESVLIPPGVLRSPHSRDKAPRYLHAVFENYRLNLDNLPGKVLLLPLDLRPDLTALVKELIHPGTNTNELVEVLLIRLLIGLERSQQNNDKINHISTLNFLSQEEIVEQIEAYMQRNLHRNINRNQLAEIIHRSPSHLARVFKQTTGKTLTERLIEFRILRAKQLLLESTLSVSEISLQIGYTSFSHFSKIFRNMVGVSPGDYRRLQGNTWGIKIK